MARRIGKGFLLIVGVFVVMGILSSCISYFFFREGDEEFAEKKAWQLVEAINERNINGVMEMIAPKYRKDVKESDVQQLFALFPEEITSMELTSGLTVTKTNYEEYNTSVLRFGYTIGAEEKYELLIIYQQKPTAYPDIIGIHSLIVHNIKDDTSYIEWIRSQETDPTGITFFSIS